MKLNLADASSLSENPLDFFFPPSMMSVALDCSAFSCTHQHWLVKLCDLIQIGVLRHSIQICVLLPHDYLSTNCTLQINPSWR